MMMVLAMAALATSLTLPPAADSPAARPPKPRVERVIDRGPIYELVIACGGGGTAIIAYSKLERTYCAPRQACDADLVRVLARTCR